jgi:hypothetical protein
MLLHRANRPIEPLERRLLLRVSDGLKIDRLVADLRADARFPGNHRLEPAPPQFAQACGLFCSISRDKLSGMSSESITPRTKRK